MRKNKNRIKRKKVGVDLDDTLFPFNKYFLIYRNKKHNTNYREDDIFSFYYEDVFNISTEEIMAEMDDFYKTREYEEVSPVKNSVKVLKEINKTHDLIIITARPYYLVEKTKKWLKKNFGDLFLEVIFTNLQSLSGEKKSKAEVCLEKNIEIFIEDNFEYALDCAKSGIKTLLFNKPWNKNFSTPKEYEDLIIRVNDWNDVLKIYKRTNNFSNL
ncbi:MAG: hypothetical protein QXU20_00660 [Candidatus Woesearchaeota archaeon]